MNRYKFANPSLETVHDKFLRRAVAELSILRGEMRELTLARDETFARGVSRSWRQGAAVRGAEVHRRLAEVYANRGAHE